MIIVVSPSDHQIIATSQHQSATAAATYGQTHVVGTNQIPQLGQGEDLFFVGHGITQGDSGNAEIGDQDGDFAVDGLELWDNFRHIFPAGYRGRIYVDACRAANFHQGMFSLIETFHSQTQLGTNLGGGVRVYGRSGEPSGPILAPGSPGWVQAT